MIAFTIADHALTAVEFAAVARDRAAAIWTMTGPTRRAARVYSRALLCGVRAAAPRALAAIATLAVLALALGLLAYRRGRAFRSWCDALVSTAEQQAVAPPAIAIPPAPAPIAEPPAPPVPAIATAPMTAAALRKICAREGMPRAARATKAQCLEFLRQLAQSPENPAPASVATMGG